MTKYAVPIAPLLFLYSLCGQAYPAVNVTLLGQKQYLRTTGKTNLYQDQFPGVEGTATLIVTNGDQNGKNRVSSATVQLNGQQQVIENIRNRRQTRADELLAKTRQIRKKITAGSGKWDGAKALRDIRYAS